MRSRKNDKSASSETVPSSPISLLGTTSPTGALLAGDVQGAAATASEQTPTESPSPFRFALPELDPETESASASGGRTWPSTSRIHGLYRRTGTVAKVSSLEELYAAVPELAGEHSRLRVERISPEWVTTPAGRVATSGVLGFLHDLPTTEDFARRFGGRTYRVYAMVDASTDDDPQAPPREECRGIAELKIPLDPNLDNLPLVAHEEPFDMSRAYQYFRPAIGPAFVMPPTPAPQPAPDVAPVLNFAGEMVKTFANKTTPQSQLADPLVAQVVEQSTELLREQNRKYEEQIRSLQDRLDAQSQRPSTEVAVLQSMSGVLSALKGSATSEEIEGLRRQHEREIERMTAEREADRNRLLQEHAAALERIDRDRASDIERLRRELDTERQRMAERERDLRDAHEKELRMIRDDADRRLREKDELSERRERDLRERNEHEIARVRDAYESRIKDLERSFASQLDMHRSSSDMLKASVENSASVQIEALRNKVAELTAQLAAERDRASRLEEQSKPKPFMEQLREHAATAEAIGAMASVTVAPVAEEPSPKEKMIQTLVEKAAERLPEILQVTGVGNLIGRLASADQAVSSSPDRRNAPRLPVQVRQLPQQRQPRLVMGEADGSAAVLRPQTRADASAKPATPSGQVDKPAADRTSPPAQRPTPSTEHATQPGPSLNESPSHSTELNRDVDPWAAFEWTTLSADVLRAIFSVLEDGFRSASPADVVASHLAEKFSPDVVSLIPSLASIDKVVSSVSKSPATASSCLASPKGRTFLRNVWAAIPQACTAKQQEGKQG